MTTKMGEEARNYLHERGLTDEVIRHFQLGLAQQKGIISIEISLRSSLRK